MPITDKGTLRGFFRTGSIPSESNYTDLIDSCFLKHESEEKDRLVVIEDRGNDRIVKLNMSLINDKIKDIVGETGEIHNSTIIIKQPYGDEIRFSLNQSAGKEFNIKPPTGTITVTNSVVGGKKDVIQKSDNLHYTLNLSEVAFTGKYDDLYDKPDIPDISDFMIQADWKQTNPEESDYIKNKPKFANGKLYITQNGSNIIPLNGENETTGFFTPETETPTYYVILAPDWNAIAGSQNEIKNKPLLSLVATTGNYHDLLYKPEPPNNSLIKIYRNKVKNYDNDVNNGGGYGATATGILSISVKNVSIVDAGAGYSVSNIPNVTIDPPAGGGVRATAQATVRDGEVIGIIVTEKGSGYSFSSPPTVTIDPPPSGGGNRKQARAVAILDACLDRIVLNNSGGGYISEPLVTILGGNDASAKAIIENEKVIGFDILSHGYGFHENVEIIIGGAPIAFTLNQPNDADYDLGLGKTAISNDYNDLENQPIIGDGNLIMSLNKVDLSKDGKYFNANYYSPYGVPYEVNINAATKIVLSGDVLSETVGVDENGLFSVTNVLKEVQTTHTTKPPVIYTHGETLPPVVTLNMVDSITTDGKGRITAYSTISRTIDLTCVVKDCGYDVFKSNTVNTLANHKSRIETLELIGGRWIGRDFTTLSDLNNFNTTTVIPFINHGDYTYVVRDETHPDEFGNPQICLYRWSGTQWLFAHVVQEDPVGQFTNSAFGFIKGDDSRLGYVNAQPDGTGKVNLLPTVLDFDCSTKKIWLSGELPEGYSLFGFSKGNIGFKLETELVSCNSCFCEYQETDTAELCDPQWKTFIICESDTGPTIVGLRDWVLRCEWVVNGTCDPDWKMFDITNESDIKELYSGHGKKSSNPAYAVDWDMGTNLKDAFVMHDHDDMGGYNFDITKAYTISDTSTHWKPPPVDFESSSSTHGAGETHSIMGKDIPVSNGNIVNKLRWIQDNHTSTGTNMILKVILYRRTGGSYKTIKTVFMTSTGGVGSTNNTILLVNDDSSIYNTFLPRNIKTLTDPNGAVFLSSRTWNQLHNWFEFDLTKPDWNDQWKCLITD